MKRFTFLYILMLIASGCHIDPKDPRPNIVLIMGDDIGFSDLGCYGGEIQTPNLDKLAAEGIRFSDFYNMSKCETTRSVLLTGLYQGNIKSVNIASLLGDAGYNTIQCGKEHFQKWVPEQCYAKHAFQKSLVFWTINEFFIPPDGELANPYELNGVEISYNQLENEIDPLYKTDVLTDYALKFLREAIGDDKPFFLYMPYNSAHYPLQARPEDIARFRGSYKAGWDKLRQERYERMTGSGILNPENELSPPTSNVNKFRGHPKGDDEIREKIPLYRPWESLSEEEKDELDLEMSVFAAMVYRLDLNVGRIVSFLEENHEIDNTLIIYLSDNGSCPYDSNVDFDHQPGPGNSYRTLCAAWANLGNTPFKFFKQFGHEGGAHTHLIANWPEKILNKGSIVHTPGHVVDLYPTLLEVAGVPYPEQFNEQSTLTLHGRSLHPVFIGQEMGNPEYIVSGFGERFRMFRNGKYKIVKKNNEAWELYDLYEDRTELNDLASTQPEKVKELESAYWQWQNELP
ncbi:sulfatase-like hydrolase/transferase [Bacteroidota bacterium]